MKLFRHLLLYGCLLLSLSACPTLDAPAPLAPLATPKTQKGSYKANTCRVQTYYRDQFRRDQFAYDAEGKLVRKLTTRLSDGVFPEWKAITTYTYNAAGFLIKTSTEGPESGESTYQYDAAGKLIVPPPYQDPNVVVLERDAAGRELKANYYGTIVITTYNAAGNVTEYNTTNQDGYRDRSVYDNNGNSLLYERRDDKNVLYETTQLTYDDKLAPEFVYSTFKGFPPNTVRRRNILLASTTKDGKGAVTSAQTYTYTYNAVGYPLKVTWKITGVNTYPGQITTAAWTNEYVGCQ